MDRLWIYRKRNAVASTAAPGSDELGRGPFSPGARQSHGKRSVLVTCPTFAGDAPSFAFGFHFVYARFVVSAATVHHNHSLASGPIFGVRLSPTETPAEPILP